jgi:decaprenylphospho-beta-D-ribofuranose 2-oxidase
VSALPGIRRAPLSGWGRYPHYLAEIYRPEKFAELAEIVAADKHQLIARGAGRSHGDAAVNAPGRVIDLTRFNRMLAFDPASGILRCEGGVTIGEIIETFVPRGFFPPVVPGARFVTIGGAVAADIHGRNHHRDSAFCAHIRGFDLMLASGEIRRCSREENADLFHATAGGMGLTGIILEAEIALRPIESAWLGCEVIRAANIDHAIAAFERRDAQYNYSAAWIDAASARGSLGRAVVWFGNFAARDSLDIRHRGAPFVIKRRMSAAAPFDFPAAALNPLMVHTFNSAYYRRHPDTPRTLIDYERFFFPLDSIRDWNRIYGSAGFVRYQCVFPERESREGLVEMLEAVSSSRRACSPAGLKKFGAQEGILSFPMPGYTLSLDFPMREGLMPFLERLDEIALKHGGRVYLAADARMRAETFAAMYLNLPRWRAIKREADPDRRFSSSLSRRLQMDPD